MRIGDCGTWVSPSLRLATRRSCPCPIANVDVDLDLDVVVGAVRTLIPNGSHDDHFAAEER